MAKANQRESCRALVSGPCRTEKLQPLRLRPRPPALALTHTTDFCFHLLRHSVAASQRHHAETNCRRRQSPPPPSCRSMPIKGRHNSFRHGNISSRYGSLPGPQPGARRRLSCPRAHVPDSCGLRAWQIACIGGATGRLWRRPLANGWHEDVVGWLAAGLHWLSVQAVRIRFTPMSSASALCSA
jgi:hypothetical protein